MSGQAQEALKVYERMLRAGADPTATTYTALISAYGKNGQLDRALQIFEDMVSPVAIASPWKDKQRPPPAPPSRQAPLPCPSTVPFVALAVCQVFCQNLSAAAVAAVYCQAPSFDC